MRVLLSLIVFCFASSHALGADVAVVAPDVGAKALYAPYLPGGDLDKSFVSNRTVQDRILSKPLLQLVRKAAERDGNDSIGGILGFDPVVNGQDFAITRLEARLDALEPDKNAVVIVTFRNLEVRNRLRYSYVWEQGGWRIDNIESLADPLWNLRTLLGG